MSNNTEEDEEYDITYEEYKKLKRDYNKRQRNRYMNQLIVLCNEAYSKNNRDLSSRNDCDENYDPVKRWPEEPKYDGMNSFRKMRRIYYIDGFIKSTIKLI